MAIWQVGPGERFLALRASSFYLTAGILTEVLQKCSLSTPLPNI